jgi:hypothetical protein
MNHHVKLFASGEDLARSVCRFVGPAIARGAGIVLIATKERTDLLQDAIDEEGWGCHGSLIVNDASGISDWISTPGGSVDAFGFVRALLDAGRRESANGEVAIYGDMVSALARRGEFDRVLELERSWDRIVDSEPISLLCGYAVSDFPSPADASWLADICLEHDHVEPTLCRDLDGAARIRILEQQVHALSLLDGKRRPERTARGGDAFGGNEFGDASLHVHPAVHPALHETRRLAHDLGNVLTLLDAASAELEPADRGQQEIVESIALAVRSASRIAGEMARPAADDLLPWDQVDAGAFVRRTRSVYERLYPRGIRYVVESPEDPLVAAIAELKFERILLNLLVNARAAIGSEGTVTVRVGEFDVDGHPRMEADWDLGPGRYVSVTVTDDGPGMTEETRRKVFDRGFSTSPDPARGIGLAIAVAIARSHGGDIRVTSRPGCGTSFQVAFPRL